MFLHQNKATSDSSGLWNKAKPSFILNFAFTEYANISSLFFCFLKNVEIQLITMWCEFLLYSKFNQLYVISHFGKISLLFKSPEGIEQCSLCYTVGSHQLSILCTIDRTWKQAKRPSTEKRIQKKWYIYTMKYYSAIERNGVTNILKLEFVLTSSTKQVTTDQIT